MILSITPSVVRAYPVIGGEKGGSAGRGESVRIESGTHTNCVDLSLSIDQPALGSQNSICPLIQLSL